MTDEEKNAFLEEKADNVLKPFRKLYGSQWPEILSNVNLVMGAFGMALQIKTTNETIEPTIRVCGALLTEAAKYRREVREKEQAKEQKTEQKPWKDAHIWGFGT